jgi:PAS domain S-box-containing protein
MLFSKPSALIPFKIEIRQLFYQRTHVCLWLGVIFFSLFSVLDFTCCIEHFNLFVIYRLVYVVLLLSFINLLRLHLFMPYAPHIMGVVMLLGAFVISLMTVQLNGFYSGYYVGILLMIAGAFSVLPLRAAQVIVAGLSMYVVYFATVIIGTGDISLLHMKYALNNTFFFLSVVGVAAVQSHDELQTILKELSAKRSIQKNRQELVIHTDNLEKTVQQRLAELAESALKFTDLYNNILDLVVLIDRTGVIIKINQQSIVLLGRNPEELMGEKITNFLKDDDNEAGWLDRLSTQLHAGMRVQGVQLFLDDGLNEKTEVEMSANLVHIEDEPQYFQLILRDISERKTMERQLIDSERLIGTSRQAAIFGLARLAECRDVDTGTHLSRIRFYTRILCEELAQRIELKDIITDSFIEDIMHSSVLHDIGKVGIPDFILLKPGKLTAEEFEQMKTHCIIGSETLSAAENFSETITFLHIGQEIARSHHERWDGKGYPDGLSGNDIPIAARIIALADVYDALTSIRVYKPALNHEVSKEMICHESGGQFDPRIVAAFLRREYDFKETRMKLVLQQSEVSLA